MVRGVQMRYAPPAMEPRCDLETLLSCFDASPLEAVRQRSSQRSFEERPVEASALDAFGAFLQKVRVGPFGSALRLLLVDAPGLDGRLLRRQGTYGMIHGARHYLVGAVNRGPWDLEDFGFGFELAVLKATELDLGTCWLGGTLDRSLFGALAAVGPEERIPAVSPVGYAAARRTLRDQVVRLGARSSRRMPFGELFFHGRFGRPLSEAAAGPWAEALEAVRLGPSASNMQPWRVVVEGEGQRFHFFRQRSRVYSVPDSVGLLGLDLQRVDLGIALGHFSLVAQAAGRTGRLASLSPPPSVGPLPPRTLYVASFVAGET